VHGQASRLNTDEVLVAATGKPLDLTAYRAHLRSRYLGEGHA
jgi:carboxypeptidase Taq